MDSVSQGRDLELRLPLPPSINHQYATVQGRRVLSRTGREYKTLVAEAVEQWLDSQPRPETIVAQFQGHYLSLCITFYFATALRRDLDGGLKIAQDALCEALGVNDNLVVEIHLSKRVDRQQPRIELCLTALPSDAVNLHQGEGNGRPLTVPLGPRRKKRRRKPRSLEELANRFQWE
ncbi:MAG TPA: RusA family crossover junction endodeoxyribonuclease [Candidatus Tectomicrobia bacterium]|jgi:crossover junction endodeoxyribonuclease RusA